ncbi:MAG: hypothetical protein AAGG11_13805 [Pseudomonadota bacterium]
MLTGTLKETGLRTLSVLLCCAGLLSISATALAAGDRQPGWIGNWVLNEERTQAIQPEQPESRNWLPTGRVSTSVSVGGIPLPRTGGKVPAASEGSATDPVVLRIKALTITAPDEKQVVLQYGTLDSETLHRGNYRGARSAWDRKGLKTRYQSTQRKVEHRYELQQDGSLLVTTLIKPNGAKRRTYLQLFERPAEAGAS